MRAALHRAHVERVGARRRAGRAVRARRRRAHADDQLAEGRPHAVGVVRQSVPRRDDGRRVATHDRERGADRRRLVPVLGGQRRRHRVEPRPTHRTRWPDNSLSGVCSYVFVCN